MNRDVSYGLVRWLGLGLLLGLIVAPAIALTVNNSPKGWLVGGAICAAAGLVLGMIQWQFGRRELLASQIPAANPFLVMILIPYTTFLLYPMLAKCGFQPRPLRRMSLGMFTASLSFVSVAIIQSMLDAGIHLHVGWQLVPYTILTLSEVMVSITGLEFAYSQAPNQMKSVIMGFWLFSVTLGNVLVALLAQIPDMELVMFFWLFAGLMAIAAVLFTLLSAIYRYKDYTQ